MLNLSIKLYHGYICMEITVHTGFSAICGFRDPLEVLECLPNVGKASVYIYIETIGFSSLRNSLLWYLKTKECVDIFGYDLFSKEFCLTVPIYKILTGKRCPKIIWNKIFQKHFLSFKYYLLTIWPDFVGKMYKGHKNVSFFFPLRFPSILLFKSCQRFLPNLFFRDLNSALKN